MKKILVGTLLVFALLVGALAVAPGFVDWAKYKPMIAARVQAETGYVLTLGGALDIRLLPAPHLVVENLTLTPPGAGAPLLSLERAEVQVALLPLLGGHVVVDSVAMIKPQINLLVDAAGRPGWLTPQVRAKINTPSSQAPRTKTENRLALRDIYIKGASIVYADAQKRQSYRLDDADLTIHGDGLYGPYRIEGSVSYRGKPARLSISTKPFDPAAQTVQIDGTLGLTGLATGAYDGVIGLKAPYDVQGQAKLDTPSLKKLLDFASGRPADAALDKPVSAEGLVSFAAGRASWSNLHVRLGPAGFAGSIAATNLAATAKTPLALTLTLAAEQPVDLTPWLAPQSLPPATKPSGRLGAVAPVATGNFLPMSITLPRPLTITATISAPAATYKTVTLKGVSLSGDYQDRQASGIFKADIPGGALETDFAVAFGAATRTATGGVALGDPAVTYKVALQTTDGAQAIAPFLPAGQLATVKPLLQGPFSLDAAGDVKGRTVDLSAADLTLAGSTLHLQGAYSPAKDAGRDLLSLAATADKLDVDQVLLRLPTNEESPAAPVALKADVKASVPVAVDRGKAIRNAAQKLILPFDLDVTATADRLRFKGTVYQNFSLLAGLRGPALALRTFKVADPNGNGIVAAGTIGDLQTLQNVNFSVQGQTANLKAILAGLDPKYKSLPDSLQAASLVAQVKGDLGGDAGQADFTGNLKAMDGTLDVTGSAFNLLGAPALTALTLRLRHPSFVDLARLVQPDFTANVAIKKSVDLYVSVKRDKQVYTLNDLQAEIGPAQVNGTITADMSGVRPLVKAKLQMTDLPLSDLIGHGNTAHPGNAVMPIASDATPAAPQGHWSRAPINVDWMRKADAEVSATASSVSYGSWKLENGVADLTLKNGVLDLTKLDGTLYGGQLALTGKLTAPAVPGSALSIVGDVDLQNVALQSFIDSFSASHVVDGRGVVSLKTSIATSGDSPATLIGALSGKGTATGKNILFNGFDLARLSRVLVAPGGSVKDDISDFGGALHGGSTSFNSLDGAFVIAKGVVTLKPFTLAGDAATVTMPGTVDLPLWRVDLTAGIQLTTPKDAPPLTVAIKGPLDQPGKAFGESALKAYGASKLQSLLSSALGKKSATLAAGGTTTSVKPKDLLKNVLQNALKQ